MMMRGCSGEGWVGDGEGFFFSGVWKLWLNFALVCEVTCGCLVY